MNLEVEEPVVVPATDDVRILPIGNISVRAGHNTRRRLREEGLDNLIGSIREVGVLQPIVVRPIGEDSFQIIAGERRYRAAMRVGLGQVPVVVRDVDEAEARKMAMIENSQREDLTPAEEAYFAQELVDLYDGDHERAAASQGWKVDKLRHRLQLLHAIPAVLDALINETISIGHVELLATLPSDVQANVLPRVIESNLSVAALREQLQGFSTPLSSAIFDKSECVTCPRNSACAGQLFEAHIDAGRCSDKSCFKLKSAQEIERRREKLRDEFPRVVLLSETVAGSTVPLVKSGAHGVGEEQFNVGCMGCAHRCAVIDDRLGPRIGVVDAPVCANRTCNSERVAEYQASLAAAAAQHATSEESSSADTAPKARATSASSAKHKPVKSAKAKSATSYATPSAVADQYAAIARRAVAHAVTSESKHVLAFALYGLIRAISEDIDSTVTLATVCKEIKLPAPPKGKISGSDHEATLVALTSLDREALAGAIREATNFYVVGKPDESCFRAKLKRRRFNARFVQAHETPLLPHVRVDQAFLEAHTKGGIEALLAESGFKAWMEKLDDGAKKYRALIAGGKAEFIRGVLAAGFDFSTYEPKGLAKHVTDAAKA